MQFFRMILLIMNNPDDHDDPATHDNSAKHESSVDCVDD